MDYEQARLNMIEGQIRPWDVSDPLVLELLASLRREDFMPLEYRELAYADTSVPLAHGQCVLPPKLEARMLQALHLQEGDKVLEVGTGCAYFTALLAASGVQRVLSLDLFPEFRHTATINLDNLGLAREVHLLVKDGLGGAPDDAPYDAIALTGSVPALDDALLEQLRVGGRLCAVVGADPVMELLLVRRMAEWAWSRESLLETNVPRLIGALEDHAFDL